MTDDSFFALEKERTRALVGRDLEAIRRLHAQWYELLTPSGRVFTLQRYLAAIEAEPFYAAWEHKSMRVRSSASMAAVRYQARITFPSGKVMDCWHTDTYELVGSSWLAVWSQATQLPLPSPGQ